MSRGSPVVSPVYAVVDLELTNRCNARCTFCPRDVVDENRGYMTEEVYDRALECMAEAHIGSLVYSGFGEALLHKRFFRFADRAARKGLALSLNTNGALLTGQMIAELAASPIGHVNVNVNGYTRETYEMNMPGLKFDRLLDNLKEVLATDGRPVLSVQSLLHDEDYNRRFREFYLDLGVDYIQFFRRNNRSGNLDVECSRQVPFSERFCRTLIFIANDGRIFPCSHDVRRRTCLGTVTDTPLQSIEKVEHDLCRNCDICSMDEFATMRHMS